MRFEIALESPLKRSKNHQGKRAFEKPTQFAVVEPIFLFPRTPLLLFMKVILKYCSNFICWPEIRSTKQNVTATARIQKGHHIKLLASVRLVQWSISQKPQSKQTTTALDQTAFSRQQFWGFWQTLSHWMWVLQLTWRVWNCLSLRLCKCKYCISNLSNVHVWAPNPNITVPNSFRILSNEVCYLPSPLLDKQE